MTDEWSQAFSNKSNARRAARKAGANPNSVRACTGGFQYRIGSVPAHKRGQAEAKANPKAAKPVKIGKPGKRRHGQHTAHGAGASNRATVLNMITREPHGAAMPELEKATGLLPHTLRARISEIIAAEKLKIERIRVMGVTTYRPIQKRAQAAE